MFERRLKILLALLTLVVAALVVRAAQLQLFDRQTWAHEADKALKQTVAIETSRGTIFDFKNRILAEDQPCMDACVDYRAIAVQPDEKWVRIQAVKRLKAQLGDPYDAPETTRAQRQQMREGAVAEVRSDIEKMWLKLAEVSGQSVDDLDNIRAGIVDKVERQRRAAWIHNFEKDEARQSQERSEATTKPAWEQFFAASTPDESDPDMDKFKADVSEEVSPHVILPAIDTDVQNELGRNIDRYPGLVLRPGAHRYYPYHEVAAHVIGAVGRVVDKEEAKAHPDELVGKNGVEALCEPALHGTPGEMEKSAAGERVLSNVIGDDHVLSRIEPIPGKNVRISIDIELQKRIQSAFAHAQIRDSNGKLVEEDALLHGAAVVIDVPTGEVRALVSYPTYDANDFQTRYAKLAADTLDDPLMDRATMEHVEPGSTVKPMVGIGAITSGVQSIDATIECKGYLELDDGTKFGKLGRCWVASKPDIFEALGGHVAHHPVPWWAPHPTGRLTFADGLERSCNIFFETTADRLGIARLSDWYSRFGLGRKTGIGIAETAGKTPIQYHSIPASLRRWACFSAGIGEGYIAVTPLQMANAAATIARRGIWMRPTLLVPDADGDLPATVPGAIPDDPSRVDLHLDPAAVDAAHEGMFRVVNFGENREVSPEVGAGTGTVLAMNDQMLWAADVCGKTGTAQTSHLGWPEKDAAGQPLRDENGRIKMYFLTPSTLANPNPATPWYRGSGKAGTDVNHSWYIGFAPRAHPKIAFAVLVEYGGSGGIVAASVARHLLHDCIDLKYLPLSGVHATPPAPPTPALSDATTR